MTAKRSYECDRSGVTAPAVDYDLDGDDELVDLPLGWTEVHLTRVVANPAYAEAVDAADTQRQLLTTQYAQAAGVPAGADVPPEIVAQVDQALAGTDAFLPPRHVVETRVFHVSPDQIGPIHRLLDMEDA